MSVYIGETIRALQKRVTKHQNNSNLRAVINVHKKHSKHDFEWKNANIVDYESNWFKRTTSEMLHIECNRYALNKKTDESKLNDIYNLVIQLLV